VLAYAFRPYLSVLNPGDETGREEYWSVRRGDIDRSIKIFYALSYYKDLGDLQLGNVTAHPGDAEWIILQVTYANGRWGLQQAKLSAHWDTGAESTETVAAAELQYPDGGATSRPLVWVAEGKHANYKSRSACNSGGKFYQDSCFWNSYVIGDPFYDVEVLSSANLGNSWHQAGQFYSSRKTASYFAETYWLQMKFYGWQNERDDPDSGGYYKPLTVHGF
jgi:hypothetical protein